jgi:DHA3 family macrolide efflux protein-like MFS transporter
MAGRIGRKRSGESLSSLYFHLPFLTGQTKISAQEVIEMDANQVNPIDTPWKARFFTIWTGQAFSLFGSQLVQFALVWWLTQTTKSATVLATATLAAMLPGVVLGPFVGALVDRWNRRLILMASDSLTSLTTVGLIYLFWIGIVQPWHVFVILFLRSLASGFQFPAMQASTSLMVPQAQLSRVAGLNQALNGCLNIVAPPAGAFLLGAMPMHNVLMVDILTASLAVLPLVFVTVPQPLKALATPPGTALAVLWGDVRAGFRYVRAWTGLLMLLVMAMAINFLINPAFSLSPLLVTKHFGGGVFQVGWFESAFGIGLVAGGVLLGVWGGFSRRIVTALMGVIGIGVGIILIGMLPGSAFGLALAGVGFAGFMSPICNGATFAIIQAKVAPEMQGRVMTLMMSLSSAMTPLSLIVAGPVSDHIGIQAWYLAGGIACILIGAAGFFIRPVMAIEDHQDEIMAAQESQTKLAANSVPIHEPAE